ncbi:MAG: LysE family transporter [Cyclobacteriaceae bacterium]
MEVLITFAIAFSLSFVGTIPPGTLSLSIIQLGLNRRINVAWRMAFAAALIEYPYAWIAIEFHEFVTKSIDFTDNFHLITGLVMVLLGILNLWSSAKPTNFSQRFEASGFRKGMALGLLNPLAIPFWMAMTAYLKSHGWVDLSDKFEIHAYLLGVSTGTLVLFVLLAYLARSVVSHFKTNGFLQKAPGVLLILLGLYSFAEYIFG